MSRGSDNGVYWVDGEDTVRVVGRARLKNRLKERQAEAEEKYIRDCVAYKVAYVDKVNLVAQNLIETIDANLEDIRRIIVKHRLSGESDTTLVDKLDYSKDLAHDTIRAVTLCKPQNESIRYAEALEELNFIATPTVKEYKGVVLLTERQYRNWVKDKWD